LEERHHAGVAKPKRGCPLPSFGGGPLEPIEGILGQHALVTDAFDFQELAVDLIPQVPEMRQIRPL
jgi:hypothetical protein